MRATSIQSTWQTHTMTSLPRSIHWSGISRVPIFFKFDPMVWMVRAASVLVLAPLARPIFRWPHSSRHWLILPRLVRVGLLEIPWIIMMTLTWRLGLTSSESDWLLPPMIHCFQLRAMFRSWMCTGQLILSSFFHIHVAEDLYCLTIYSYKHTAS